MTADTTTGSPAPLLLRGGRPYGEDVQDILIREGRIAAIGGELEVPDGVEVIDAEGCVILPGLVDLHTHLREPGGEEAETVETGTRAAARGGFTAVHAMANTTPVADTAGVVEQVAMRGEAAGWCSVRPVGAVTASPSSTRWRTPAPASACSATMASACTTRC